MPATPGSPDSELVGNGAVSKPVIPDYELVRIVGRGSYGDVWLARSVTGAWRAIKVVWRDRFANAEPFEREFCGLKEFAEVSLGESSQMALLHVGRNETAGFFYYVMELADDAERDRAIDPKVYVPLTFAEMRLRRGRIPAGECARFGAEVARVLASLHRRGLVHRDVKPSNIILVSGVPKLADIGLVAAAANAQTFVGTEGYVPPEGPGAPSADVFALAKVLYELSTGHDRQEFPKLPTELASFPDRAQLLELNEIVLRACGPAPTQRYRDGAAILADLVALNAGVSLRTRRLTGFLLRIAAVVGVVFGLGFGGWYWKTHSAPPPAPVVAGISPYSVAVLPFANTNGAAAQEYFSDGISDEILHALEREHDLRVTGSRSAFSFKDEKLSSVEVAKMLRVAQLVEGSLQRTGTRVRMQVRLTRAGDGASERIGTFEREENDVFALEDDVARAVAQKILHRVSMPAFVAPTENIDAYDAFLHGRALQVRINERAADASERFREAANYFERAVELDPSFGVAWTRLAEMRHRIGGIQTARGTSPESSLPTIERALAVQPELALAWCVRGFIVGVGQAEAAAGQRDLVHAEELGGANAETRMTRFLLTWFAGESRGLLPLAREAIASNPESIERLGVVALAMAYLGDYFEADRLLQRLESKTGAKPSAAIFAVRVYVRRNWRGAEAALRFAERAPLNQPLAIEMRVRMLAALGRTAEAAKLLGSAAMGQTWEICAEAGMTDRARELAGAALPALRQNFANRIAQVRTDTELGQRDDLRASLIAAEIQLEHRETALALLDEWRTETQQRPPNRRSGTLAVTRMPGFYAVLGQNDVALTLLRQAMADGKSLGYELRDTPSYVSLRDDPRFLELRRQAEAWAAMQPNPPDEPTGTFLH